MNNINIKDAKEVLNKLLYEIDTASDKANAENNFTLVLRFLYTNLDLQKKSADWIESIENKEKFPDNILKKFYYVGPTHSKYYKYFVNELGIALLVKTEDENSFDYNKQHNDNNSWLIPIDSEGCLDADTFNGKYGLPVLIGHIRIYELMQKAFFKDIKENYEVHHIVCNNDFDNKNDARDNRWDNIIYIPKSLHVHAKLNEQEYKKADTLYKETLKSLK